MSERENLWAALGAVASYLAAAIASTSPDKITDPINWMVALIGGAIGVALAKLTGAPEP